jgi:hypothetical protein
MQNINKRAEPISQAVKHLPSIPESLGSIPTSAKIKQNNIKP